MTSGASRLLRIGATALILVMLALFARQVDWDNTWDAVRNASVPLLALAAAVNLAAGVLKAVRWWVFLRPIGVTSPWLALRATLAGAALNNVVIASGGEAARVVMVARSAGVDSAPVVATLALERLFDVVGYLLLLAGAALWLELPASLVRIRPFAVVALGFATILFGWLLRRRPPPLGDSSPDTATWTARWRAYRSGFLRTISTVSSPARFTAALLLSLGAWGLQIMTYHLTARAAGFPISVGATVAGLLAVNLGFLIRVTPGNVGLFQAAYAATAVAYGLDRGAAVGVAFLIQAQQIIPVTLIGIALAPELLFKSRAPHEREDVPATVPAPPAEPRDR